jgi:Protein of unknown function (DUF1573)
MFVLSKRTTNFNLKSDKMKKVLFLLVMVALVRTGFGQGAAPTSTPQPKGDFAVAQWETTSHDFGKIKQGVPVTFEFKFANTGKVPLIITTVQASCGCTTPAWTTEPVLPGGKGFVKATFSAGALSTFDKTVTVTLNTEQGTVQLKIKGEVVSEVVQ